MYFGEIVLLSIVLWTFLVANVAVERLCLAKIIRGETLNILDAKSYKLWTEYR